jgi:hypothetical protein
LPPCSQSQTYFSGTSASGLKNSSAPGFEYIAPRCPGISNSHQQRLIAIDYGTTNPMVFLDIYDDGHTFWVVREYYWDSLVEMRQKTDAEYADDLVDFSGREVLPK